MSSLPDFSKRSEARECMDSHDISDGLLQATYRHLGWVNLVLSRSQSLMKHCFLPVMRRDPQRMWSLLDIGCGGGDVMARWLQTCRREGIRLQITALDSDARALDFSRKRFLPGDPVEWWHGDVNDLVNNPRIFDFVFSNHLLHHLDAPTLTRLGAHLTRLSNHAFVMNDLLRSRASYLAFSILTYPLRHQSFLHEDGRISIRRGFRSRELMTLIPPDSRWKVGISHFFPGRLVIIGHRLPGSV